jgi:cell division control protein 7
VHAPTKPRKISIDRRADVHTVHAPVRLGWGGDKDGGAGKLDRRPEQHTVRAGTRGFRAPEVLMRCATQTPAIDVWSAGVVMLSVLSGTSPFFLSNRDVDGLAEIAVVFGESRLHALAKFYGKTLTLGDQVDWNHLSGTAAELRELCTSQFPEHPAHAQRRDRATDHAYILLEQLLAVEPHRRITAADALKLPFFSSRE